MEGHLSKCKEVQQKLKEFLEYILDLPLPSQMGGQPEFVELPVSISFYKDDNGIFNLTTSATGSPEAIAIVELVRLLEGKHTSSIKKCEYEGCGRYFYNPTARKKRFCSVNCAWKHNAKKRREEDPEYKRKQADLMYEKYEEKVKRKFGENVKPKRRKRYKYSES